MPMVDVTIPEGALNPAAEQQLLKELGDILIGHEGFDRNNEEEWKTAQSVTMIFLHRPAAVYVAGAPSPKPRYRIVPTVPEGQYTQAAREALVRDVTAAVVRAEGGTFEEVATRIWVFPSEIDDGCWGSRGGIRRVPEIQAFIAGEHQRKVGEERLARRRRVKARELLQGALDALQRAAD